MAPPGDLPRQRRLAPTTRPGVKLKAFKAERGIECRQVMPNIRNDCEIVFVSIAEH